MTQTTKGQHVDRQTGATAVMALRQRLGLTQEGLAWALGVTYSTVNRWEKTHVTISPLARQALRDLAEQRGVPFMEPPDAAGTDVNMRPARFGVRCSHCGAGLVTAERVGDNEAATVAAHLREAHPDILPPGQQLTFGALMTEHVRVRMA